MRVVLLILVLVLAPILGASAALPVVNSLGLQADGHCQPTDHHGAAHSPVMSDACQVNCALGGLLVIPSAFLGLATYGQPIAANQAMDDVSPDLLSWPPPRKPPRS